MLCCYIEGERFWGDGLCLRNIVCLINEMKKLKSIVLIAFMLVYAFVLAGYFVYDYSLVLKEDIGGDLRLSVFDHANNIDTFLVGKKGRAVDFGSDGFIKNRLKEIMTDGSEDVMDRLDVHLIANKIIVDDTFYEVFALDTGGKVVGTTGFDVKRGDDFSEDSLFLEGKLAPSAKNIYDEEAARYGIVLSAPVLLDNVFVGVIVIKMTMEEVMSILDHTEESDIGGPSQMYISDRNFKMITPSTFLEGVNQGAFVQDVTSESVARCFLGTGSWRDVLEFVDFKGDDVFGVASKIEEADWCLMVEESKEEFFDVPLRDKMFEVGKILLVFAFVFGVFGYFLQRKFKW